MSIPADYYSRHSEPSGWKWEYGAFLETHVDRRGKLLDVGCGDGLFLAKAREAGYAVRGFDASERAVEACHRAGLKGVQVGTPGRFRSVFHGSFDVVTCFHTLEHVEDPLGFATLLAGFVGEGGRLVVAVPNSRRFTARLRREVWDFPPHHLTRWTPDALRHLLVRAGLGVERIEAEAIELTNLDRAGYTLWLAVNALTQTGFMMRKSRLSPQASGTAAPVARVAGRASRSVGSIRTLINTAVRRSMGPALLRLGRGRRLEGPGLLAIARKV